VQPTAPAQSADLRAYVRELGRAARAAARALARAHTARKNEALRAIAARLRAERDRLLEANRADTDAARAAGLSSALLDRLALDEAAIEHMAAGLEQVAALPDPVGQITGRVRRPSGIEVGRMRVPLGVIAIVYEARPNVTADAAGLCLKAGNACLLRGGSEALASNQAIAACVRAGLVETGLPETAVQVLATADRAAVGELATLTEYVDLLIPRGGKELIARLAQEARVPMLKHLEGICHVYIDDRADVDMAVRIADNAKTQRYGTCNTMETLLVAAGIAPRVLPPIAALYRAKGVEMRGCPQTRRLVPDARLATEADYRTEWLGPVVSMRVVAGLEEAIEHIARYGSQHTDAIVTEDGERAERFLREVDSSSVMWNASTRFADGYEYGLGAEIGISTDRLHARGPVGLEGLTTQKYVVYGHGEIRAR